MSFITVWCVCVGAFSAVKRPFSPSYKRTPLHTFSGLLFDADYSPLIRAYIKRAEHTVGYEKTDSKYK